MSIYGNRGIEFNQEIPFSDLSSSSFYDERVGTGQVGQRALESQRLTSSKVNNGLNKTEVKILSSNKIETILRSVQYYINDLVLKGTCEAIRFDSPTPDLTANYLELVINTLDIGLGISNLIQKNRILEKSQEALTALKKHETSLSPNQLKRLKQLENFVNYQKSVLPHLMREQGLRMTRSALANIHLVPSFIPSASSLQPLMAPLDVTIGGINAAISGLFLQQALDQRHLQDLWIKESKSVFSTDSIKIDHPTLNTEKIVFELPPHIHQLQQKRLQSQKNEKEVIKNKILDQWNKKELSREKIEEKLKDRKLDKPLKHLSDTELIDAYLSYQIEEHTTIDPLIKGAVVEMIKKKHEIEKKFLNFKVAQYGTSFTFSAITVVVGLALLIALLFTPVGPAALILLCLNIACIASSAVFFAAGNLLAYEYKPELTIANFKGAPIKLIFYYAMHYLQSAKDSVVGYFMRNSLTQEKPTQSWLEKAHKLQEKLDQLVWKDFAKQANLQDFAKHDHSELMKSLDKTPRDTLQQALKNLDKEQWDTLEVLNEALSRCDLHLLRQETREILEKQLGFDLSIIEEELKNDPLVIKKILRNFFNLGNTAFAEFMGKQRGSIF